MVTGFIGLNVVNSLKSVSMSNQECKVRPVIMNINSERAFILFLQYSCK